jgi:ribosomal protein S18 acetylase RimI-like enzyme
VAFVDYLDSSGVTYRSSPSESARFGYSTDRITVSSRETTSSVLLSLARRVSEALEESNARIVILRYPAEMIALLKDVGVAGRSVYPGGSLAYWSAPLQVTQHTDGSAFEVSGAQRQSYGKSISDVLSDSFAGYVNHYAANPLLAEGVVVEGYDEWARSSMANPENRVFVVTANTELVGVAVIAVHGTVWEIELAGIAARAQRQGHYLQLMRQVIDSAQRENVEQLVISTQSHNVAVQRAWAKLGFVPIAAIETVHLVRHVPSVLGAR